MNYHTKSKKYYTVIITVIVFLIVNMIPQQTFSQEVNIQIDVKVEKSSSSSTNESNITIEVEGNQGDYSYYLYDNLPHLSNGELQKSDFIAENTYVFYDLPAGEYYVCVYDKDYISACKKVKIEKY